MLFATTRLPGSIAAVEGILTLFTVFTPALRSSSSLAMSLWPFQHAPCKGVQPFCKVQRGRHVCKWLQRCCKTQYCGHCPQARLHGTMQWAAQLWQAEFLAMTGGRLCTQRNSFPKEVRLPKGTGVKSQMKACFIQCIVQSPDCQTEKCYHNG
jgi:hypothetical protein